MYKPVPLVFLLVVLVDKSPAPLVLAGQAMNNAVLFGLGCFTLF